MSTNETKLQDVIQTSLQNIKTLIDTNTIIGTPINHPSGTVIIPVSKVAMAYATGGLSIWRCHRTLGEFLHRLIKRSKFARQLTM